MVNYSVQIFYMKQACMMAKRSFMLLMIPIFYTVKSFYSLDYTEEEGCREGGGNGPSTLSEVPEDEAGSRLEDYNKIILELQSHRKEIEKLQITTATSSSTQTGCENQSINVCLSPPRPALQNIYKLVQPSCSSSNFNRVELLFLF